MNQNSSIIHCNRLTKKYGSITALSPIDIHLESGTALALLGRNGSGKSTLIRLLMGFISPTSGSVKVLDEVPLSFSEAVRAKIAYVADSQDLPSGMTGEQYLSYIRPFYQSWDYDFEKKLVSMFDVPLKQKIRNLSRGQRVKLAFVGALSFHPTLLLLDEPFSGLDPAVRDEVLDALFETMTTQEWTMVISSHEIEEVEKLADQIIIMDAGHAALRSEKDELLSRCRVVTLHSVATMIASSLPAHWWNPMQLDQRVTFVDSQYDEERLLTDLQKHFPDHRHLTIEPAPLRNITRALLRHND